MEVTIVEAQPQPIAVVARAKDRADWKEMLDTVYAQVRRAPGRWTNVMVYRGDRVEAGVLLEGRGIDLEEPVILSATPEGRAATAHHVGDWSQLASAHRAVRDWCDERGHLRGDTVWEIYGHAEQPETWLFHLLA